ncbi:CD48 antigen-like isoform X4 [Alosa sapidissima]|uniref:CD48 antigen-like isoform X4 n=1 Tax=Alosa sapidissima TaxID=34773 RepID=UPI001C090B56|nr:CD48 antigen-like isoform X4 [Alosa sapidissima]
MDSHTLLTLWILAAVGLCSCQDELLLDGPLNRTVGGNVVFTLINPPSIPPSRITWTSPSITEIITTLDDAEKIHPDYTGRISLNKSTASLELSNLTPNDTGEYTLSISINSVPQQAKTSLTVFETIAGVAITRSGNTLIAGESSVNLTCDAQGFIVDREWTKDGKPLSLSNRTTFYEKNRTLSISPVETEDSGQYTCIVSNPVSSGRDDFELVVNLAPDPGVGVGGFPTWAIAVIVIAVLIVLVIPVILVLKKKGKICPPKSREAPAKDNSPMELNYADISHFQRKNVQRVDQGNQGGNEETLYSGVRLPSSPAGPTSGQGPTYADINFQNNAAGMRPTLGHGGNVGDQSTVYAAVKPKGQAPGPPRQVPDVTYAQVKK